MGARESWFQRAWVRLEFAHRISWRDRHALNYCMLLPGPEAQQLCVYIGWLLHHTWGGIVAGSLFVLPSAFAILAARKVRSPSLDPEDPPSKFVEPATK